MIRINIVRDKDHNIREFIVEGHAGFSESGSDIICSAVSVLAYTAAGALEDMAGISGYVESDGYMRCFVPSDVSWEQKQMANIILETIILGFKQVELSYRKYVSVLDEEV